MLQPYFYSLQEFLEMGGHGLYVWICWGITVTVFIIFILFSIRQRRTLIKELAIKQTRQKKRQKISKR